MIMWSLEARDTGFNPLVMKLAIDITKRVIKKKKKVDD